MDRHCICFWQWDKNLFSRTYKQGKEGVEEANLAGVVIVKNMRNEREIEQNWKNLKKEKKMKKSTIFFIGRPFSNIRFFNEKRLLFPNSLSLLSIYKPQSNYIYELTFHLNYHFVRDLSNNQKFPLVNYIFITNVHSIWLDFPPLVTIQSMCNISVLCLSWH